MRGGGQRLGVPWGISATGECRDIPTLTSRLAIGSSPSSSRSAAPYWDSGTWVFDDERVGLVREPFVIGVPDMIDHLVRDIPDAREGFRMVFSKTKYPGYGQSLSWRGTEDEGNWYQMDEDPLLSGWLCPALSLYFPQPPEKLYVSAEPLAQAG